MANSLTNIRISQCPVPCNTTELSMWQILDPNDKVIVEVKSRNDLADKFWDWLVQNSTEQSKVEYGDNDITVDGVKYRILFLP